MPFHEISIKKPSASQLAKMWNGQSFRIARGNGIRLVVDSDRIKDIGNKFLKDKAHTMKMTMDEIKHNMIGNGIFGKKADDWMKKHGIKSAVYAAGDALKPMAHTAIDAGAAALTAFQPELAPLSIGAAALAHNYIDKPDSFQPHEAIKKSVNDQISPYTNQINALNNEYGTNLGYMTRAANEQINNSALNANLANAMGVTKASQLMAPILTQGISGPQTLNEVMSVPSVLGAVPAHVKNSHSTTHHVKGKGLYSNLNGRGLGASLSGTGLGASLGSGLSVNLGDHLLHHGARAYRGQGLHARRHGKHYEKGSISAGGSIMNQQSLSSQPYLENWVSASFLPPAYQKFHTSVTM